MSLRPAWPLLLALLACTPAATGDRPAPPTGSQAPQVELRDPPPVDRDRLRQHLAFLADDAQEGRPPGTAADLRVQDHVERAMRAAGLKPGFGDSYRQIFDFIDGVRLVPGKDSALEIAGKPIPHALVPFSGSHDAPLVAPLVYVGFGIPGDAPDSGDYAGLLAQVKGAIVVARGGSPADPHIDPVKTRATAKLIAARDRGAVGFLLWEPEADVPYPNHGEANDLTLPALTVAREGTPALLQALGRRGAAVTAADPHAGLKRGALGRKPARLFSPVERVPLNTANVAGLLPGTGAGRLVLGAHMDHLGRGTSSSLAPGVRDIHNGADDNASGVAALLTLADALAQIPAEQRPYDLQFVAFAAEERGLYGSKRAVEAMTADERKRIVAMLNFDMVGRLREQSLVVVGVGTSGAWPGLLERAAKDPADPARSLLIKPSDDGFGASDQASYYAADIPVLHFFSGTHDDYHKPTDDLDKINVEGAAEVADLAARLVAILEHERPAIDFKKVAQAAPRGGGFRVSLGTVPDYAAQVDGLRLDGVRPGSPAEVAGLKKGDVIVKIGAREIHNMDDYMAAFADLQPGVAAPVAAVRDGARLELSIVPAAPTRR